MSRAVNIRDIDRSKVGPNSPLLALMRRKPRRDLEHEQQTLLFQWAAENEAKHPELRWLFAVPNWIGVRTAKQGARLKAEGRKAGVPDAILPVARGGFRGLAIELKIPPNKPTKEQMQWLNHLASEGWMVFVAYTADAAEHFILDYLAGKPLPIWAV